MSAAGTAGPPSDQVADTSGQDESGQGESGQGEDASASAEQLPNRTRRRSRRNTAPPSVTAEQANVTPAATQTAPAGEPGASTVIVASNTPGDSAEPGNGGPEALPGQAGERNGAHEQANGHTHDADSAAEAEHAASDVPSVTPPARRPVRRGASRPAGPPVNATHDG